jgi:16S rRNA pseudouridine516 synthase
MQLAQILFTQGFGTRRICAGIIAQGLVRIDGRVVDDPRAELDPDDLIFEVEGRPWRYAERALVMLHKPAGYECSQKPRHHPSVLSLLPQPLRTRGVQPVGRLDEDTTGLLLLTDDGTLIRRLTSPKRHVPKIYEVGTRHPVTTEQVARLLQGVVLEDDPQPVRAAAAERTGDTALRLTLTEGKYHQVKRMVAAVGNRVETLHRSTIGGLMLPADLAPGGWRWLGASERAAVLGDGNGSR